MTPVTSPILDAVIIGFFLFIAGVIIGGWLQKKGRLYDPE